MTETYTLNVWLPSNRALPGLADLLSPKGVILINDMPVLGKADNARAAAKGNSDRDPTRVGGDTPLGQYAPARLQRQSAYTNTYGRYKLPLTGVSGDALEAVANGRKFLLVHGGHLTKSGKLMPTYGCLRMRDEDLQAMAAIVKNAPLRTIVSDVSDSPSRAGPAPVKVFIGQLKKLIADFERKAA
jgi:hypothetical protein